MIRKNVILILKSLLDGKVIYDSTDETENPGNGKRLHVYNKAFEIDNCSSDMFPLISVLPGVQDIVTGLYGHSQDSDYKVAIFGFINKAQNEELAIAGENAIELIVNTLTDWDNIQTMCSAGFSIVHIGPILNESYYENADNPIAYISLQIAVQFSEN